MNKTEKKKRNYGAVTVFLTLILIPCLIFTCAFGDISRVQLSKSQATAAADLSLYTLMSNYDEDLKEYYGLVASCQSIDDYYDTVESYFTGMMTAAGLDGTASETIVSYISSLRTGSSFVDFLQVEETGETTITAATNSSLGSNPALIEDGIVEFMKYRGPVQIVEKIIDRFSSLDLAQTLEDAEKDDPIVEAKQEFAEAEGEMMGDLLYTYLALIQYSDYYNSHSELQYDKFSEYAEDLSLIRDDLQGVTKLITNYYSYTSGISDISGSFPVKDLPTKNGESVSYGGTTYTKEDIGADEDDVLTASDLTSILDGLDTKISAIETAGGNINSACSGITYPSDKDDNEAYYCMKMQNAISSSDLSTISSNGTDLMKMYAKILVAEDCTLPEKKNQNDTDWAQKLSDAKSKIERIQRDYLSYGSASTDFETYLSNYVSVAWDTVEGVQQRKYPFESSYCDGAEQPIGTFLQKVNEEYGTLSTSIDQQIANIDLIIDGGEIKYNGETYDVVSLETLKESIKTYISEWNEWGKTAEAGTTTYAEQEQSEYEGTQENNSDNELANILREEGDTMVDDLNTRLTNIRNDLQSLKTAIESLTYGGTQVIGMTRETAITAGKTVVPTDINSISSSISANDTSAEGYNNSLVVPLTGTIYTAPTLTGGKTGNEPNLDKEKREENQPTLYYYLDKKITRNDVANVTSAKDQEEEKRANEEDQADKAATASKGKDDTYLLGLGKDLSNVSGGAGLNAASALTGIIDAVKLIVGGNLDEFRDKLYVCEYVMDMFSYSSFNNEGQYNLAKDDGKNLTIKDFVVVNSGNSDDKNNGKKAYADYLSAWQESNPQTVYENQSLTNKHRDNTLNVAMLGEAEYVIYGNKTNQKNLEAAYSDIFTIREIVNLISGFQNFYTPGDSAMSAAIEELAAFTFGITCGVVPVPLTKVILIGVLATMESVQDLNRLKAGTPVVLYKTSYKEWYYGNFHYNDLFSGEADSVPEDVNGLFYSDYIYIFLVMAASNDNVYKAMLTRIGDLIEANMGTVHKGFDLDKSICYFQLDSTLQVKPLMMKLKLVSSMDGVDPSGVLQSTDWCTYTVKVIRGYS